MTTVLANPTDVWGAIMSAGSTDEQKAEDIVAHVEERLRQNPHQCLPTVLDLVDVHTPERARNAVHQLDPETLTGVDRLVWEKCARFPDRWIEHRLSPSGEEVFSIVVHGAHDEKYLCGRYVARKIDRETFDRALDLIEHGITPKLVIVYAGDSPDDTSYRHEVLRHASRIGIAVEEIKLDGTPTAAGVKNVLHTLNQRNDVHGVLVQTIRNAEIISTIRETLSSWKDPEYINSRHMGHVLFSEPNQRIEAPSTAMSCQRLIHEACGKDLRGKLVCIINGSAVIGRPLSVLLNNDGATTVVCNRFSGKYLDTIARMADVIVTATGKVGVVNARHMKPGLVIIDAAITRKGDRIVGDIKVTKAVHKRVAKITPVPGGVGPVTSAMLLSAVVDLAKAHHRRGKSAAVVV